MNLQRHTYNTGGEKTIDFFIGFVGWFVLNGVMAGLVQVALTLAGGAANVLSSDVLNTVVGVAGLVLACLPLLVNIGLVVFFAFTRYWIALGAVAAFAASLIITLCLGILFGAACLAMLAAFSSSGF